MTADEAAAAARVILGSRARTFRDMDDRCCVARHELLLSGLSHTKVYGTGATWADAVAEARDHYYQMRRNPTKGTPQQEV